MTRHWASARSVLANLQENYWNWQETSTLGRSLRID
jgi:hypothetical protein